MKYKLLRGINKRKNDFHYYANWNSNVTKKISILWNDNSLLFCLFFFGVLSWALYSNAFIWDDSYFYLVIARNIVLSHHQTFSNIFPTNGFHPLWLYVLTAYSYLVSLINPDYLFNTSYAIPLSALFVAMGCLNFIKAATKLNLSVFIFAGVPLAYVLFFPVLYSEAHMYYFALSLLTRIAVYKPHKDFLLGSICGIVFLSRLDSIFIVLSFLLIYYVFGRRFQCLVRCAFAFLIVVIPYLMSNVLIFGGLLPISGWIKSSLPAIFLQKKLFTINSLLEYNIIAGIVPLLFSCLVFVFKYKHIPNRFFHVYFIGSALHFFYTAFFARFHTMYWWYYISNIILFAFAGAIFLKKTRITALHKFILKSLFFVFFCVALLFWRWGKTFADRKLQGSVHQILNYIAKNDIQHKTILVSDVPGVIAFETTNNIIAADMLTANRKYFDKMRASTNALEFIFTSCEIFNKPIQYIILFDNVSSKFLELDRSKRSIKYFDSHVYPIKKSIGQIEFYHEPDFITSDKGVFIWKISDKNYHFPSIKYLAK